MSNPCTVTLEDGTHYDLSSLASAKSDYVAEVGETSYNLNVCRGVIGELYKIDDPDTVGGFVRKADGDFSLGRVNTNLTVSPMTNEPMLIMTDGSPCPLNPDATASTAIRFICSPADFHAGKPVLMATLPPSDPCHFYFEWKSHVACPTNPKQELQSNHYYVFGAILFIAILTWFGGLTLYNRLYLKKRGLSQFPIPSFHLPSISLPGTKSSSATGNGTSSGQPRWGSWGRRSNRSGAGGYSSIRAEAAEDDEEEGFAGRFSLEDDDEDAEDLTGGETDAWRSHGHANGAKAKGNGSVGVHQGLVDI
ncbi:hypothetical protein CI109_100990 [Kwoniella shandongensis]|uniref:Uncharacterized protein n=1 Tax=Kwoniella shandongensis TaxID=1734106 RepID=A0A5M6C9H7_9TREE|nr:uncharacterized protein CI109_001458 [Kwoniella shandongensis]KAA5530055.1 hypothetical protein CI109_001458 [Kwoniella shandongensis]